MHTTTTTSTTTTTTNPEDHTMHHATSNLPSTTREMVAVMRDDAEILGHIAFYMLPSVPLPYLRVTSAWKDAGLPQHLISRTPSAEACFKNACRALETRRHLGQDVEIRVAMVADNDREVVFQITWQIILTGQQTAEYPKALRLSLHRQTESIDHQILGSGTTSAYTNDAGEPLVLPNPTALAAQVREQFTRTRYDMPVETFRRMVRETLRFAQATNLRTSGGIFFVPAEHRDTLRTLGEVVTALTNNKAEWARIPVANESGVRQMVRDHFIANCTQELDDQITRIRDLRATADGPGTRAINAVIRETRRLARLKASYEKVLNDELGELEVRMQILQSQAAGLATMARPGAAVIQADPQPDTTPTAPAATSTTDPGAEPDQARVASTSTTTPTMQAATATDPGVQFTFGIAA